MDALSVAVVANGLLTEYVRIHDDIFARSFWRSIRRIIPIAGIFEAIPYATHANSLAVLRNELRLLRGEATTLEAPDSRPSMVRFCMAFEVFAASFDATASQLMGICLKMAATAERLQKSSWADYSTSVAEYERLRTVQQVYGTQLNEVVGLLQRES